MTQDELGEACPKQVGRNRIHNIETGPSSTSVDTLLNIIHGLGVPGRDDAAKLSRFFAGPARQDAEEAIERAAEGLLAVLSPRGQRKAR